LGYHEIIWGNWLQLQVSWDISGSNSS